MKRNAPSKDADSLGDVADEVFFVVVVVFRLHHTACEILVP